MANEYDFKGKNGQRTRRLFENRKKYRDEALFVAEDGAFVSGIQDFFVGVDLSFYGRVDESRNFVYLQPGRTRYFKSSPGNEKASGHRAADFVVDAYENFIKEFETLVRESRCGISAKDINLKVVSAWIPHTIATRIGTLYTVQSIERSIFDPRQRDSSHWKKLNDLITIEQFMDKVSQYVRANKEVLKRVPITDTSVLSSVHCSVANSGLSIILRDSKFDDDEAKSIFMNEIIFDFYRQAALKHGFVINKNAPWQIVANLDSSAMVSYMEERLTSKEDLWNTHYTEARFGDLENVKRLVLAMWNGFVDKNPVAKHRTPRACGGTTPVRIKRARYTPDQLNEKIKTSQWIKLYCEIKAIESVGEFAENSLDRIIKTAIGVEKNLDIESAVSYINEQYKSETFENRLPPQKFLPNAEKLEKGQQSNYQSNVTIETIDYY